MIKYMCNLLSTHGIFLLFLFLLGCSDSTIDLGNWSLSNEKQKFVFLSIDDEDQYEKEINKLKLKQNGRKFVPPEISPLQVVNFRDAGHKSIGEPPKFIITSGDGASVTVSNHGYVFLQISKKVNDNYDDIEWGWKITIENNSKFEVLASIEYGLLDKNGFILTTSRNFFELKSINPNSKETFQSQEIWRVRSNSTPHSLKRVAKGDYGISLQYQITVICKEDL